MRLASFDYVTAVAVLGAIDALQGQDTVIPPLDLTQTVPEAATVDLTDFDLDDLMSVEIGPATPRADLFDFDLGELSLEQLLALEARPADTADEPQADIAVAAIEDLLQVEVRAAEPDRLPSPFDLTGLALETLEDLQFGDDARRTETPHRQFAALDLTSHLDKDDLNEIVLIDRSVAPSSADSSHYAAIHHDAISTGTATLYVMPVNDAPINGAPINIAPINDAPINDAPINDAPINDAPINDAPINVAPINDAPVAIDDSAASAEDSAITLDLLVNDSDPDGDALTVTSVGPAGNGTATLNADGTVTYTPDPDFSGVDSFIYAVDDGNGGTATAKATVDVAPANDAPVATDDSFAGSEDSAITLDLLANDSDPDGDALTVTSVDQAGNGTVTLNADGTVTYTPDPDFSGVDSFIYAVDDGNGGTATATATVTVAAVNDAPVANDDSFAGSEDTAIAGSMLANDSDADGDALTITSVGPAGNGTVMLNADGTVTYTPDPNFAGVDSFTYTIDDGNGGTATATATVTVDPVNDAPIAIDDGFSGTEDTAVTGNVLANDKDPDGDTLTVTAGTFVTANGGTVVMAADGGFTYTPPTDFNGVDSFDYTISDGNGGTATAKATVDVAPVNDAPVAKDDSFAGSEDSAITLDLLANDSDPDGDALTVTVVGPAGNGTVTLNADGTITYTPDPDFSGVDSFTYTVDDGNGGTATATATVTVAAVNDAPVANADNFAGKEDVAVTGNLLANDTDPDGDTLTVTAGTVTTANGGSVMIAADGSFTYTPAADFNGIDSFGYTVNDGNGGTATATATVSVAPVNDAPVAIDDFGTTTPDTAIILDVLANDSDPEGDPLTVTTVTQGANGSVVLNVDGTLTYSPDTGFIGTDNFTYTVDDGNGGTATATVTLTVSTAGILINGTNGHDILVGTTGDDEIRGRAGNDELYGMGGNDTLVGGAGSDLLDGGAGNDTLDGKAGNDLLYGMGGNDTLIGGAGEDLLVGNAGADWLQGGGGDDTAVYAASTAGVTIDLGLGTGSGGDAEGDTFSSIEFLIGSDYDDILLGAGGNNTLDGGAGNDILFGGGGKDTLSGGEGNDTLIGGLGRDSQFGGASDDILEWDSTDTAIDGGTGTDTLRVTSGDLDLSAVGGTLSGIEIIDLRTDTAANTVTLTAAEILAISDTGTLTIVGDIGDTAIIGAGWTLEGFDLIGNAVYIQTVGADTATLLTGPEVTVVEGPSAAPVAVDDSYTLAEDSSISGNLLANDSDPNGDTLTVTAGTFATIAGGIVVMATDGTFTYTPPADFNGVDSFDYTISDGNGGTATATATIDVAPVNDAPVATDDSSATLQDTAVVIDVLANDTDPDGDALSVTSAGAAANGTVVINVDGTLTYTPNPGYTGTDSFTYTVDDGNGGTATGTVTVSSSVRTLIGTVFNDIKIGGASADYIDGLAGHDVLIGLAGNDSLFGRDGDDGLEGGAGADFLSGGLGNDTASYIGSGAGVSIDLALGSGAGGDAEGDTLSGIESLIGSAFDDVLRGDGQANALIGGAGNDILFGGAGTDVLFGGAGADSFDGGAGIDTASYSGSGAGVSVDLATGLGTGGAAKGDTLVNIENLEGSVNNDTLAGDDGANILQGGAGNDVLLGGGGDDIVDGGLGSDVAQGLAGNDIFMFSPGTGSDADLVSDFTIGEDLIDLTGFGLAGMTDLSISADSMGTAFVLMPSGDSITLGTVDPALLTGTDFIF